MNHEYFSGCCAGVFRDPVSCSACMFSFDTPQHLFAHLSAVETDELHQDCAYRCHACFTFFSTPTEFLLHLQSNAAFGIPDAPDVGAPVGVGTFAEANSSASVRQHGCSQCGKTFRRLADLQRHLMTHTDERPFGCELCGRSFKIKSTLDTHRKTHEAPTKQIACSVCHKHFLSSSALKLHMRAHTNETPFACTTPGCERAFRTKKLMHSHQRRGNCGLSREPQTNSVGTLMTESLSEVIALKRSDVKLQPSQNSAFSAVGHERQPADNIVQGNPSLQGRQIVVRTMLRSGSVVDGAFYGSSSAPSTDVVMDVSTLRNLSADGYILSMPLKKMGLPIELVLLLDPTAILARLSPHSSTHFSTVVCPVAQQSSFANQPVSIVISQAGVVQLRQLPSFLVECFSAHTYVEQNRQVLVQSCLPMIEAPRGYWDHYGQHQH